MRRRTWGLLLAAAVFSPVTPARASVPVVIIDGRGWGHGVGMAQDGAFWMAKSGASAPQILGQFYPGASIGKATGTVRVGLLTSPAFTIALPNGGRIDEVTDGRQQSPFPIVIEPGGRVGIGWSNGSVVLDFGSSGHGMSSPTTTTEPATTTTLPLQPRTTELFPTPTTAPKHAADEQPASSPSTPAAQSPAPTSPASTTSQLVVSPANNGATTLVERNRSYRGVIDLIPAGNGVHVVNRLDVEQYLRGMGEVRDPSWPIAALRTQAIAARTYALRAMSAGGELCDTTRCQVYLGAQAEYPEMDKAISSTAGQVLTYNKALASAVYSANAGGQTATPEEGFGTAGGGYPYLRSARYQTQNPMPWTVTIGVDDLAAHLGRVPIASVAVASTGPSGRALTVAITGTDGIVRTVTGRAFAAALGLRSTMFTVRPAVADVAPPAITGGSVLQAPPDEVGAATSTDVLAQPAVATATPVRLPDTGFVRTHRRAFTPPVPTSVWTALVELAVALSAMALVSSHPFARVARRRSSRAARPRADDRQ